MLRFEYWTDQLATVAGVRQVLRPRRRLSNAAHGSATLPVSKHPEFAELFYRSAETRRAAAWKQSHVLLIFSESSTNFEGAFKDGYFAIYDLNALRSCFKSD